MMRIIQIFIVGLFAITMQSICLGSPSTQEAQVIIFVSFSMPKDSLKGWMQEAEKIHAPVVIRGLVNNSFKETLKKMTGLAHDNHGGVQLDPALFQKFQINRVPAVVVTTSSNCLPNQSCREEYDVIYGDVHLDYALKKIAAQKDAVSSIAEHSLVLLRESHNA
jgi:conjugal transfer pilus assembly protein TrbC